MSETPSFTANLFSGPCFGDMTPPEPSTPIHAPSSSSPLPASTSHQDLIEFSPSTDVNATDSMSPSANQVSDPANEQSAIGTSTLLTTTALTPLLDDPAPMEFETVSLQDELSSEIAIPSAPLALMTDTAPIPEDQPLTPLVDMHPLSNSPGPVPTESDITVSASPAGQTPMPLEADACSSPPSSSPNTIFSSSPPAASDSSVYPEDLESPHKTAVGSSLYDSQQAVAVNDSDPIIPTSSPSSSPIRTDQSFEVPPLSSSPLPSSSPPLPRSSPSPEEFVHSSQEPSSPLPAEPSSPPKLCSVSQRASSPYQEEMPSETTSPNVSETQVKALKDEFEEIAQVAASPLLDSAVEKSENAEMPKKRKREEESEVEESGQNHQKIIQPPNPKRPTLQFQKLQRMTLVKPFRSPAMSKPKVLEPSLPPPPPKQEASSVEQPRIEDLKKKHRTQRAAGQFKSPLSSAVSASLPSVRQTPTIQTLESKVQVLKRAIKIKKEGEEETLEGLVKKWTEAGREVAWEVWGLVKDNEVGGGDDWGKDSGSEKRKLEDSWGWSEDSGGKRIKTEAGGSWGWDEAPVAAQDADHANAEEKPKETMSTMLMRLGIAPSTLGWNEVEEEFLDDY